MSIHKLTGLAAAVLISTSLSSHASTVGDYFVQPIVIYSTTVINGLATNGSTSSTQSYYNAPVGVDSRVDIGAGTLKGFVETSGGSAGAVSQSRFGDAITVANGIGTQMTFNLGLEGSIASDAITPELNSSQQVNVDAYLSIYDLASGANSSNWANHFFSTAGPTPLSYDRYIFNGDNHTETLSQTINQLLTGSVDITQNNQSFLVFANFSLTGSRNNNPGLTTLDFKDTATFGLAVEPGVTFSSASGVFPGSVDQVAPVPLPAGALLLGSALLGLAFRRRRAA